MADASDILGQNEPDEAPTAVLDTPEPPEPAPEPQADANGRLRDASGKFVATTKTEDTPPAAESTEPPAEIPAPEGEQAPATDPNADVVPWSFRGSGRDIAPEGAAYKPGVGVLFPDKPETMDYLRQALTRAEKYEGVKARAEKAEQALQSSVSRHQIENVAMRDVLGVFLDPEKLSQLAQQAVADPQFAVERLAVALEKAQIEIERQFAGKVVELPKEGEPSPHAVEELAEQMDTEFTGVVASVWPDITPDERAGLEAAIAENYRGFLTRAPMDDPRGRWVRGQVIPSRRMLETFVRGERAGRPAPQKPANGVPPAPSKAPSPSKAPPTLGGPARNLAGANAGKPKPNAAPKDAGDYFGIPTFGGE